ncbi:MAG TPA: hypothetical protein VF261_01635 [Candidatus Saccharimonadales bacterium]
MTPKRYPDQSRRPEDARTAIENMLRTDGIFVDLLAEYEDVHGRAEAVRSAGLELPEGLPLADQEATLDDKLQEWRGNAADIYLRVRGDQNAFARGFHIWQLEYRIGHSSELGLDQDTVGAMEEEFKRLKGEERRWLDGVYEGTGDGSE